MLFESLETRTLLAADVLEDPFVLAQDDATDIPLAPPQENVAPPQENVAPPQENVAAAPNLAADDLPQYDQDGEGEDAPDLVAFAKALDAAGVEFYGAGWCPFCNDQKALFEDGAQFLPYIEVTGPDRTLNQIGIDNNISVFPTWVFPDGSGGETRETGILSLQELSDASGVAIPQSSAPSFADLPSDVTVLGGAPLHLALDGYDPNGTDVTFTVTSSDPSLVTPELRQGRSLSLETTFGPIVVGTFEDLVPDVTAPLFDLVENDVWDNTIFHRVINNFVIQGGDPTGTGFGDSSLPRFDDQFHVDGQHTSSNLASIAKAGDDSASSQFFFTEGPQRHLDFNHTVWGLIVEGAENREEISNVAVDGSDRPTVDVQLTDAAVFEDTENAVLTLKAPEGATGTATITVTATDSEGLQTSQSFQVAVTPDTSNGTPFLDAIPEITTTPGTPVTIDLTAQDVEGDAIQFNAFDAPNLSFSLPGSPVTPVGQTATASFTITPDANFVGTQEITVFVHSPTTPVNPNAVTANQIAGFADVQTILVTVSGEAPSGLILEAGSDTGVDDSDGVTNDATPDVTVTGVESGAIVRVYDGDTVVAEGTASGETITLTTSSLVDGPHSLTATMEVGGVESLESTALDISVDTEINAFTSSPSTAGELGVEFTYDAGHDEEGNAGFSYDLLEAPTGASIDPATGEISWTPVASQIGDQTIRVTATDLAGNVREQPFIVSVTGDVVVQFNFELFDLGGNPITEVSVGDRFVLVVSAEDPRSNPSGVFAGYLDVMFEQGLVEAIGPINHGSDYTLSQTGAITSGVVDEVGAAAAVLTPFGGGAFTLFSVEMEAKIAGTERIFGDPADTPVTHDVLVFGSNDPVPTAFIDYGEASLTIGLGFGANGDIFNFDEDTVDNALDVLNNDESTGSLTITSVTTPDNGGTVTINATNDGLIYTPAADFNGSETFEYTVSDGTGAGDSTATVVIQVQPVNDDPTAVDDTATVFEDSTDNFIDVLSNDLITPDDGETLRVTGVGSTTNGGVARIGPGNNHVEYDPPADFTGTDSFTYTVDDGNGGTSTATVTITVDQGNDDPVANNDTFDANEDSSDIILDVLVNDNSGPDTGETLTITDVTGITDGGTVEIINGGTQLRYTPAADFSGFESFTYALSDGNGGTDQALVTVDVANTNDVPTATDDSLIANKNQSEQELAVLDNDVDPDPNDTLTIDSVTQGSQGGTVAIAADGQSILYTPDTDFVGEETFTYTVVDADGESSQATATVNVRDFVPSSLSGFAYLDVNNDGIRGVSEMSLFNITIMLEGSDNDGNTVSLSQQTAVDGSYSFVDLAPGTYTIMGVQPAFLLDGIDTPGSQGGDASVNDQITIDLSEGTDGTENNFGERGLLPQYIGLLEGLASLQNESMLAAVSDTDDNGGDWYAVDSTWASADLMEVTHPAEPAAVRSLQLVASDGNGGMQQAEATSRNASRLHSLGSDTEYSLFRIHGTPDDLTFLPTPTDDTNTDDTNTDDTNTDDTNTDDTNTDDTNTDDTNADDSNAGDNSDSGAGDNSDSGAGGEGEGATFVAASEVGEGESSLVVTPQVEEDLEPLFLPPQQVGGEVEDEVAGSSYLVEPLDNAPSSEFEAVDQFFNDEEIVGNSEADGRDSFADDESSDVLSLDATYAELGSSI